MAKKKVIYRQVLFGIWWWHALKQKYLVRQLSLKQRWCDLTLSRAWFFFVYVFFLNFYYYFRFQVLWTVKCKLVISLFLSFGKKSWFFFWWNFLGFWIKLVFLKSGKFFLKKCKKILLFFLFFVCTIFEILNNLCYL